MNENREKETASSRRKELEESLPRHGRRRVVIEAVRPAAGEGVFPVKRVAGDEVSARAKIYADGHEELTAWLLYRRRGEAGWHEAPMERLPPECPDWWHGSFQPDAAGFWEYNITAWVDPFLTWREGLKKKSESGVMEEADFRIGAGILESAAAHAECGERQTLAHWAETLRDGGKPLAERLDLALSEAVKNMALAAADRSRASRLERDYPVLIEREKAAFSTWYEMFPRSWGDRPEEHGTFKSCRKILPEIARMGFDVVYLPPIHPVGRTHRKGRNNALEAEPGDPGSPWAIGSEDGGHKAVHPRLGTLGDFRGFVEEAGRHGLETALDIAFQCSPDHPYVKDHPEWFKWRPDGTVQFAENPPKKYEDILPFDFETEDWRALWLELYSIFEFWIGQGVKIFRVDNPHTKPFEFWRWLIGKLKEAHPAVILLAEAFTRPNRKYRLAKCGFTQGYTYFTWRNNKREMEEYLEELAHTGAADYFWPNFFPNTPDILHEELQTGGRPAFIARYVLAATLSSNTGIYGPAFELCENEPFPGKEEYNRNEKYEIKAWDWDRPGNIKDIIARVNRLRRENPALQRTFNLEFLETDNPRLIAYMKRTPDLSNVLLVVVNFDFQYTQSGWLTLPLKELGLPLDRPYQLTDLLPEPADGAQTAYTRQGSAVFIQLVPQQLPAHIFKIR